MANDDHSNSDTGFVIKFGFGDVEMMVDLLNYGVTRALMSGAATGRQTGERLKEILGQFKAISPIPRELRSASMGYEFLNAFEAVSECDWFSVTIEEERGYGPTRTALRVDVGKESKTESFDLTDRIDVPRGDEGASRRDVFENAASRIEDMLFSVAPMDAQLVGRTKLTIACHRDKYSYESERNIAAVSEIIHEIHEPRGVVPEVIKVDRNYEDDHLPEGVCYVVATVVMAMNEYQALLTAVDEYNEGFMGIDEDLSTSAAP